MDVNEIEIIRSVCQGAKDIEIEGGRLREGSGPNLTFSVLNFQGKVQNKNKNKFLKIFFWNEHSVRKSVLNAAIFLNFFFEFMSHFCVTLIKANFGWCRQRCCSECWTQFFVFEKLYEFNQGRFFLNRCFLSNMISSNFNRSKYFDVIVLFQFFEKVSSLCIVILRLENIDDYWGSIGDLGTCRARGICGDEFLL